MENRTCQNCQKNFVIESADFAYYEKMKVPAPTWCPQCRMMRRFMFVNIWNLYKRTCEKCGKKVISIYSPAVKHTILCQPCWWKDDWDGTEFAMDYDPSRPFLAQVKELIDKTPYSCLESAYLTNVKSDYTNSTAYSKNCYMTFWSDYSENVYYSTFLFKLKDSLDCYRMKECELCYEIVGGYKSYRAFFSEELDSCSNMWFCRSCTSCTNCFGCVNLRGKNYCIFNEQYSKEEYVEKLKEFHLDTFSGIDTAQKAAREFWNMHPYRFYDGNSMNYNVTGDYIYESKNAKDLYMSSGVEDSRFVQFISFSPARDCYDYSCWGNNAEKIYESYSVGEGSNNVKFSGDCWPNVMNIEYSVYAIGCKNAFGCVNLKRKEYCILNKQYPKEEYLKLVEQIREDMIKNPYVDEKGREWKYGEFLPIEFSPFGYNETIASAYFEKSKQEVLDAGYKYYEGEPNQYKISMKATDLPETIEATPDEITKEIIECENCGKAFRLIDDELFLMRRLAMPVPHKCPTCRQAGRFHRTNPPIIYDRHCDSCGKDIKTAFAPGSGEIVYCETCYQKAIL